MLLSSLIMSLGYLYPPLCPSVSLSPPVLRTAIVGMFSPKLDMPLCFILHAVLPWATPCLHPLSTCTSSTGLPPSVFWFSFILSSLPIKYTNRILEGHFLLRFSIVLWPCFKFLTHQEHLTYNSCCILSTRTQARVPLNSARILHWWF